MTGSEGAAPEAVNNETPVSEGAAQSQTKVDDIAERLFQAFGPVVQGENPLDVIGALEFVKARFESEVNKAIDASEGSHS